MATINARQRCLNDFKKIASVPRFMISKMPSIRFNLNEELVFRSAFEKKSSKVSKKQCMVNHQRRITT